MARTRRDILREKRDKDKRKKEKKGKKVDPNTKQTSIGFMKGGLAGAGIGFVIGYVTHQKAFFTIAGFLAGGYLAENVKRMKAKENKTKSNFVNFNKRY